MNRLIFFILAIGFSFTTLANDFLPVDPALKEMEEELWSQAGFSETEVFSLNPSTSYPLQVPITLVMIKEPKSWTPDLVIEELRGVEKIYSQCQISFGPITLVQTTSKLAKKWWSDFDAAADAKVFQAPLLTSKPTLIYRRAGGAYAWPAYYLDQVAGDLYPQLLNTAIVSYKGNMVNKNLDYVPKDYNVSAHELAHILLDSPHRGACGDLIHGGPTCKGTHLPPSDCEILIKSALIKSSPQY